MRFAFSAALFLVLLGSHAAACGLADLDSNTRTVLLRLVLSKSGGVREATLLGGPTALAPAAIEAAKRRKYKRRIVDSFPDEGEMMVAVTFREDNNGAPEIRQARPAGVSSCVHPEALRMPPWLNLWLSEEPLIPVLVSETKK
jgi:hypothetical protein